MSDLRLCVCCDCRFAPPNKRCPACGVLLLLSDAELASLTDATDEHSVGDDEQAYIRTGDDLDGCRGILFGVIVSAVLMGVLVLLWRAFGGGL